ncbi:C-5 cytosine-specific DNA methylase [methanogenic archaeon mixed culture ISO4-G1]|nr:C-5 cytosine-specific DNA methylase [methanogenic archaeon mixed culture ISO4-G1]
MRIAFEDLGGECIYSCEKDPVASKVYMDYFGDDPLGDITTIKCDEVLPEPYDILLAGFPCQAFSMAGNRLGFDDDRGKLFDYLADIIEETKPKAFLLENVKGLCSHKGGETMNYILDRLRKAHYFVPEPKVLNAYDFNVPQRRERVYIVGFRDDLGICSFDYPKPLDRDEHSTIDYILEKHVDNRYYLSQGYLDCLKNHKVEQKKKGRGYSYAILDTSGPGNTLMTGGMGRERNLVYQKLVGDRTPTTGIHTPINSEDIRRLTPREFSRMQGFPRDFDANVSDTSAYRLFGNSVAINVVYNVGLSMLDALKNAGAIEDYQTRDPESDRYDYR